MTRWDSSWRDCTAGRWSSSKTGAAFQAKARSGQQAGQERIEYLEDRIQRKDEVLAGDSVVANLCGHAAVDFRQNHRRKHHVAGFGGIPFKRGEYGQFPGGPSRPLPLAALLRDTEGILPTAPRLGRNGLESMLPLTTRWRNFSQGLFWTIGIPSSSPA